MRRIMFLLLLMFSQTSLYAQSTLEFDPGETFSHDENISFQSIRTFRSVSEADGVIRSIMSVVGLKPNFEICAADMIYPMPLL